MKLLFTYAEAAEQLGLPSAQALRDLVYRGKGPEKAHIGARVLFHHADLVRFAEERRDANAPLIAYTPSSSGRRGRPSVRSRQQSKGTAK